MNGPATSASWDVRRAASLAIGAILSNCKYSVKQAPSSLKPFDVKSTLKEATLGAAPVTQILQAGAKLSRTERLKQARQNVKRTLGIQDGLGMDDFAGDLVKDEDLMEGEDQDDTEVSTSSSVREQAQMRRKSRLSSAVTAQQTNDHVATALPEGTLPFVHTLHSRLLHPTWTVRHGALLCLRSLVPLLTDSLDALLFDLLRLLCLDRFSDFVGDGCVAPVRETAAQLVGDLVKGHGSYIEAYLSDGCHQMIAQQLAWQVRHSGLLLLKHLHLPGMDELLLNILADEGEEDEDICALAAEILQKRPTALKVETILRRLQDLEPTSPALVPLTRLLLSDTAESVTKHAISLLRHPLLSVRRVAFELIQSASEATEVIIRCAVQCAMLEDELDLRKQWLEYCLQLFGETASHPCLLRWWAVWLEVALTPLINGLPPVAFLYPDCRKSWSLDADTRTLPSFQPPPSHELAFEGHLAAGAEQVWWTRLAALTLLSAIYDRKPAETKERLKTFAMGRLAKNPKDPFTNWIISRSIGSNVAFVEDELWNARCSRSAANLIWLMKNEELALMRRDAAVQLAQSKPTSLDELDEVEDEAAVNDFIQLANLDWKGHSLKMLRRMIEALPIATEQLANELLQRIACHEEEEEGFKAMAALAQQYPVPVLVWMQQLPAGWLEVADAMLDRVDFYWWIPLIVPHLLHSMGKDTPAVAIPPTKKKSGHRDIVTDLTVELPAVTSTPIPALPVTASGCLGKAIPLLALDDPIPAYVPSELCKQIQKSRMMLTQLTGEHVKIEPVDIPPDLLNIQLRPYQVHGISWMSFLHRHGLHGILADDMGLGKTVQTLTAMALSRNTKAPSFEKTPSSFERSSMKTLPSLVVCPSSLTSHWVAEAERYTPSLTPCLHYEGGRRANNVNIEEYALIVVSYDCLRNDLLLPTLPWDYVVLDEGQVIRNWRTRLHAVCCSLQARHRLILSGTPIQNHVNELWSLFHFLLPGYLGASAADFHRQYGKAIVACQPVFESKQRIVSESDWEGAEKALSALHRRVLPFILRRLKETVLNDLPPKIIQDRLCSPHPVQLEIYQRLHEPSLDEAMEGKPSMHIFKLLQVLRKLWLHPCLVDNGVPETLELSPKLQMLAELLRECGLCTDSADESDSEAESVVVGDEKHRCLIFCQQQATIDMVIRLVMQPLGVKYLRLDGTVPPADRPPLAIQFNQDPSIDCLLLTTSIGGLGLTLTGADTVIMLEHDWNPQRDLQAMDRAHRLGQKRTVMVYRLIIQHSLEESIMGLQRWKKRIAGTIVTQQNAGEQVGKVDVLDLLVEESSSHKRPKVETLDDERNEYEEFKL